MNEGRVTAHPQRWLYALIGLHVFLWTLIPALTRKALPLDVIEGLSWGHEWQWGYDKNPYLNAWVSEVFSWIGGASGWSLYLASQLCVAGCFWSVWRLAEKMLTPLQAVSAAFLLEGIYYITIVSPQFNDNMLELVLWPLSALFLYQAIERDRWRDWLLMGLCLGLGLMAKYLTALLMAGMGLFLLINPRGRAVFFRPGFYVSALFFFILVLPHIYWLFTHDFITIQYAFKRAERVNYWVHHVDYAFRFAVEQALALLPSVILSLWFMKSRDATQRLGRHNTQFLWCVLAGPFLFLLLLSVIQGYALEPMWGIPFLTPFVIILVAIWKPRINRRRFFGLFYSALSVFFSITVFYALSMVYSPFTSPCRATAYFPGPRLAQYVTTLWHQRYGTPLSYVAGDRWEAGNVAFYSPDRPSVFMEWNPQVSPWVDESEMHQRGAVFVWTIQSEGEVSLSSSLRVRYPSAIELPPVAFEEGQCLARFGVAVLSPQV